MSNINYKVNEPILIPHHELSLVSCTDFDLVVHLSNFSPRLTNTFLCGMSKPRVLNFDSFAIDERAVLLRIYFWSGTKSIIINHFSTTFVLASS